MDHLVEVQLLLGDVARRMRLPLPEERVCVARAQEPTELPDWATAVRRGMLTPIGTAPLRQQRLAGKRIAIITDDSARPTPAAEMIPVLLDELRQAGADDTRICFITASGAHDPMSRDALAHKLGADVVSRYECIPHDATDDTQLVFLGFCPLGTPLWVNRRVAEADYRIALGRIYPHESYGYEGGYKMILPGVAGLESILSHHGLNFSPDSGEALNDTIGRRETDATAAMVTIDYLINVVVDLNRRPRRAFCGHALRAHRAGIEYADREVWGAEVPWLADITLVGPGRAAEKDDGYSLRLLDRATSVTKPAGAIICLAKRDVELPKQETAVLQWDAMSSLPIDEFRRLLSGASQGDLARVYRLRDWSLSPREIELRARLARSAFYRTRRLEGLAAREVVITADPEAAMQRALASAAQPEHLRVTVIPDGTTTIAKQHLYRAAEFPVDR